MISILLLQQPTITSRVEPGMIIEAQPKSRATLDARRFPRLSSPTGIFGYVIGNVIDVFPVSRFDTLVERVFPSSTSRYNAVSKLEDWSQCGIPTALVHGTFTWQHDDEHNLFAGYANPNSVILANQALSQLYLNLSEFAWKRYARPS